MDYQELINLVKNEFPDKAIDIMEALELLRMIVDDTIEGIEGKIKQHLSVKQYDRISYYSNVAKAIKSYNIKIEELAATLDVGDVELEETMDLVEEIEGKTIPNYSEYIVDHNVAYTLYESFTHKRPYGFKFNDNHIIEVKTWQDILLKVCEYLIEVDEKKFMNFEHRKEMNGRRKKYFSTNPKEMRKPKKIADKIYIETNQSSNSIRNIVINLLKAYDFEISEFKIYLRADYTELNKK